MRARLFLVVAVFVCAGGGCSQLPRETTSGPDVDAINQLREREFAAFSQGRPDELAALFTDDCVLMPPNQPQVNGREALRRWAQTLADHFTLGGGYTGAQVTVTGDWAYERYTGAMRLTPKAGGAQIEERVKGIHVYRRQPDGSWLIASDAWNSDMPLGPAE